MQGARSGAGDFPVALGDGGPGTAEWLRGVRRRTDSSAALLGNLTADFKFKIQVWSGISRKKSPRAGDQRPAAAGRRRLLVWGVCESEGTSTNRSCAGGFAHQLAVVKREGLLSGGKSGRRLRPYSKGAILCDFPAHTWRVRLSFPRSGRSTLESGILSFCPRFASVFAPPWRSRTKFAAVLAPPNRRPT